MKAPLSPKAKLGLCATLAVTALGAGLLFWSNPDPAIAQTAQRSVPVRTAPGTNAPATSPVTNAPPAEAPATTAPDRAPSSSRRAAGEPMPPTPGGPVQVIEADPVPLPDEIQLSFQGANVDTVAQWLAKSTGKSVIKHPRVQCQLTIISPKKLKVREAINLVYRALSLEGFTAIETSKSILIVQEGQEPKMGPELLANSQPDIPEGRQRLMKLFPVKHLEPAELRDKLKTVLSDKGTIEIADRSNQLIVTDYNDNLRLIGDLIAELDIPSGTEVVIEFYPLKFSEAEELSNLLTLVLNSQPAPPSQPAPSRSSSSSSRSSSSSSSSGPFSSSSGPSMPGGGPVSSSPPSSSSSASAAGAGQPGAQPIRIWPDKTANRLIVAAPKMKQAEVKKLVDMLDTEKPQDVSIRVIQLKHVNAEDLVRDLGPLFQKMSGQSVKDTIEVTSNTRANSIVVLSSESNFKTIERLISSLDTEEAQERAMRVFPLKNADAEDVAKQLQDLNQDQDSSSRYPFFIFSSSMYSRGAPKKPTFVADRRRNTVIVQAQPAAIENIASLIEELDQPVSDEGLAPKIFRLKYVSAVDIEDVLNELFLRRQQQRPYWDFDYYYGRVPSQSTDSQSGRLAGKVRITSEPYANAIIVSANSVEIMNAVEEMLKELDVPSQAGESTMRIELKFAKAATVANSINILFARGGSPPLRQTPQPGQQGTPNQQQQQQQGGPSQSSFELEQEQREETYFPWLGGQPENMRTFDGRNINRPVSDLVGRVRIVPDHRSNALLVSANLHLLPQVVKLVEEMDAPTPQVLIEAKIVEVSNDYLDRLGVRWSPDGGATFTAEDLDNSIIASSRGDYRQGFGGRSEVNTAVGNNLLPNALTTLRSGVISSSINLDFLIQFLRRTTDATVLSEPKINIADNELGRLFVGQQVPFIERSQSTDVGALNQTFSYKNVGVILEVTPHINSSGDVALKIRAESSSIVPGQTLFGGAILDTRNFKTDLTVKNGQTLVLGGIIQKQVSDTLRKTPILGSIPGLGWAFKKKDQTRREVELLVFLRPQVVRTPEEAKALMEEIERQSPLIQREQDKGNLREHDPENPADED